MFVIAKRKSEGDQSLVSISVVLTNALSFLAARSSVTLLIRERSGIVRTSDVERVLATALLIRRRTWDRSGPAPPSRQSRRALSRMNLGSLKIRSTMMDRLHERDFLRDDQLNHFQKFRNGWHPQEGDAPPYGFYLTACAILTNRGNCPSRHSDGEPEPGLQITLSIEVISSINLDCVSLLNQDKMPVGRNNAKPILVSYAP